MLKCAHVGIHSKFPISQNDGLVVVMHRIPSTSELTLPDENVEEAGRHSSEVNWHGRRRHLDDDRGLIEDFVWGRVRGLKAGYVSIIVSSSRTVVPRRVACASFSLR